MFEISVNVPSTLFGDLVVTAEVERGHYTIGTVARPDGTPVECSLDLLEEIETSIEYDRQCARYESLYFSVEDPAHISLYA